MGPWSGSTVVGGWVEFVLGNHPKCGTPWPHSIPRGLRGSDESLELVVASATGRVIDTDETPRIHDHTIETETVWIQHNNTNSTIISERNGNALDSNKKETQLFFVVDLLEFAFRCLWRMCVNGI